MSSSNYLLTEEPVCSGVVTYDELDKVSSLYGVGTVTGWHLIIIGLLITWCFHPGKRRQDIISVDTIVVVTLPLVALGHLIHLMRDEPSWKIEDHGSVFPHANNASWDMSQRKEQFAAYAPYSILRIYQVWSGLLLFNPFLYAGWCKRAVLVFVPAFLGTTIQVIYYDMFSLGRQQTRGPPYNEAITFVWSTTSVAIVGFLWGLIYFVRNPSREPAVDWRPSQERVALWGWMSYVYCFHLMYVNIFKPSRVSVQECPSERHFALRFIFFPYSNSSYTDLDQAVALLVGAAIMTTRLYSVLSHRYKDKIHRKGYRGLLKTDEKDDKQIPFSEEKK